MMSKLKTACSATEWCPMAKMIFWFDFLAFSTSRQAFFLSSVDGQRAAADAGVGGAERFRGQTSARRSDRVARNVPLSTLKPASLTRKLSS